MSVLFENDIMKIIFHDKMKIIEIIDKLQIMFKPQMINGPLGSMAGDNIKISACIPELEKIKVPFKVQVAFWIERNSDINSLLSCKNTMSSGDSLLQIDTAGTVKLYLKGKERLLQFVNNDSKNLCGFVCHFYEGTAREAEEISYILINSTISILSYQARVPILVHRVEVIDLSESIFNYYVTLNKPFMVKNLDIVKNVLNIPNILSLCQAWRRALSYYRESLILTDLPMYRFLALYKALEDLKKASSDIAKEAKKAGKPIIVSKPKIPCNDILQQHFPLLVGQPISKGIDYLEPKYRNAVAHNLLEDGAFMTSDFRRGIVFYNNLCSLADTCFRLKSEAIIKAVKII